VIDISAPGNPKELAFFPCVSPQGDVGVYGNLVFRSVDSPQRTDGCTATAHSGNPTGADCAPAPSPCTSFEGIQVFGISNPPTDTSPGGRINFRGGDWSSYWCNGLINESDARRGLYIWNVSAPEVRGPTVKLDYLNPQTNHLSLSAG
jgi:hypothetical protein